jgi:parallel beta-helix repeat protein
MKRFLPLLLILLLLPMNLWAAAAACSTAGGGAGICYVDMACATPGNGISQTCDGATAPFQHIAEVAALTYAAGDQILFNKGQRWQESFTIPSSGEAGNPIIIGAYGTGAKPIIDPSVLNPTWTSEEVATAPDTAETFESGLYSAWFAADSGAEDAVVYHGGSKSVKYATAGAQSIATHTATYLYFDFYYRVDATSGPNDADKTTIVRVDVSSSGIQNLNLYYKDSGYYLDISNNTTMAKTVQLTPGTWYHVEYIFQTGAGTGSAELKVDGVSKKTLASQTYGTSNRHLVGSIAITGSAFVTNIDDLNIYLTAPSATFTAYHAPWTTSHPHGLWNGTTILKEVAAKASLTAANKFFNDTDTVYVRLASDVDPSTQTMYVGRLNSPILIGNITYVTIDGLSIQHGNGATGGNILFSDGTTHSHITVKNCDIGYGASGGIFLDGTGHDIQIYDNNIYYNVCNLIRLASPVSANAGYGINFYTFTNDDGAANPILIHHNNIYNNGPRAGIEIGTPTTYVYAYNNHIYDNGEDASYYGSGITVGGLDTGYCKFYNNLIHGQLGYNPDGNGILMDVNAHDNDVYYNVVYGNAGGGIRVNDSWHNNIYNNTTYNNMLTSTTNAGEIALTTSASDTTHGIVVKNNIAYAVTAGAYAILIDGRTSNNADMSITNNDWYRASGNWYFFNATPGATLNTWNAVNAMIGTDINADPTFVSTSDFRLQAASTAIGAGVSVSLTRDYGGYSVSGTPDMGAFEYGAPTRQALGGTAGGVQQ